jgi:hypothetical protein
MKPKESQEKVASLKDAGICQLYQPVCIHGRSGECARRADVKRNSGGLTEMNFADGWLLLKKILVGIVITVVPLAIIAAGLWSIQQTRVNRPQAKPTSPAKVAYAN